MDQTKQNETSRKNIRDIDKWNLKDLYATKKEWEQKKSEIEKRIEEIIKFKDTLSQSGKQIYTVLEFYSSIEKEFMRLYAYAVMLSDQDTRESDPLAMKQIMAQIDSKLKANSSFIEPEILALSEKTLESFFKEEPGLETYRHTIDDIQRRKTHTLNEKEEKLIAQAGLMSDTAHEIFNILSNADLPYPEIELTDGSKVCLDPTNYALHRASRIREDRKIVFENFFAVLEKFKRTFGTQLYGEIKKNIFYKNVRNYTTCLESSLNRNNIPEAVYYKLIENVNKNLKTFHRYLELKKRIMKVEKLQFYDIYPSLAKEIDLKYNYEDAKNLIKDSLKLLGDEYVAVIDKAFNDRWIDVYPNTGKRSGAYMDGIAYDVHPYILMNYKGKYEDVSTLTHELGHAMHSYLSNKNQAYVNSHYPIFLAEVASTVNEALLINHVLKQTKGKDKRLSLLGSLLDGFKGTLFRQTQFAEFELKIHELTESGEALTGDRFTEIYLEIFKKYYGHNAGIMDVDDLYGMEWAYIPHFYYNFYVFQYSTSFTASQTIVEKLINKEPGMNEKYIEFLSSGCSDYAIPTLKKVGVDMTADEPFDLAIQRMNEIMDEIEKIVGEL